MPDLRHAVWHKSTRSGNGGDCVEVADNLADTDGIVLVRDSKNPTGPCLRFTPTEWAAFVVGARAGAFDRA